MKAPKAGLALFFALTLAVIFLAAAGSLEEIIGIRSDDFLSNTTIIWYAVGGFTTGLAAGILTLRRLSRRTLNLASIGLGSLGFIAVAVLIYLYTVK